MTPLALALLCQRAYDEPPTLAAGGSEVLIEEVQPDGLPDGLAVAFRGTTKNYRDIFSDLRGLPTWHGELGWCHRGFLAGVEAVWPALESRIAALPDDAPLYFTGHSKGAAEATLAAALTALRLRPPMTLVAFGSPRVGFTLGRHLAAVASLRPVNGNDVVTRHPWPLWGYRHVRLVMRSGRSTGNAFHDHRMAEYIAWMERMEVAAAG